MNKFLFIFDLDNDNQEFVLRRNSNYTIQKSKGSEFEFLGDDTKFLLPY